MLFPKLKQRSRRFMALPMLMFMLAGQSAYATNQSSQSEIINHGESSGGQGKDTLTLQAPDKVSSSACVVFVDAELEYRKQRFGEAKIATKPAKGCNPAKTACKLTIDWRYAPAGLLNYQIRADWEVNSSGC